MKSFLYILGVILILTSCVKQEIVPQEPIIVPTITDTLNVDSTLSLVGQIWVITKIQYTDATQPENRQDTLVFTNSSDYTFSGIPSNYNINLTPTSFKLTLYDTAWGHLSGTLFNYNIVSGNIDGRDFYDIFNSNTKVKIWMKNI